jgi:hypothetical protein
LLRAQRGLLRAQRGLPADGPKALVILIQVERDLYFYSEVLTRVTNFEYEGTIKSCNMY